MALIKCKECGANISTKAKSCPSCGAVAPKRTSIFTWLVLIFIVLPTAVAIFNAGMNAPEQKAKREADEAARVAAMTPAQKAAEAREKQIDSAQAACRMFSKKALKDPDSAEFIGYSPAEANQDASVVNVQVTFRATNSFGGRVPTTLECEVTKNGTNWQLTKMDIIN